LVAACPGCGQVIYFLNNSGNLKKGFIPIAVYDFGFFLYGNRFLKVSTKALSAFLENIPTGEIPYSRPGKR
jgi:hypothetical protein